jgi:hypothetical protein
MTFLGPPQGAGESDFFQELSEEFNAVSFRGLDLDSWAW